MASYNNKIPAMYERYFVYSAEEESLRQKVYGPDAAFGTVFIKGVAKRYTSIVRDPNDAKSDAIRLCKGDIRRIKYNEPTSNVSR